MQHGATALRMVARAGKSLMGSVRAPGDKSISHRALMFGALALGETRIEGLLTGDDVLATAAALRQLGAGVERDDDGTWRVQGVGVGGLGEPANVLDMGNSGTAARLLTGLLASHDFTSFLTGDASMRRRPMQRVIEPLSRMGAQFVSRKGGRLPMAVQGAATPVPIEYTLPVASAQVKSAILLAGLNTAGETTVIEPHPTRDHTERMLRSFGAEVTVRELDGGARAATVRGYPELRAQSIVVPGDPSSAAFAAVAAAIVPGSDVLVENVGLNPLRSGLYVTLKEMGADLEFTNRREVGGEPVADIRVRGSKLLGVEVPPERAPSMIDEYPILSIAASFALGPTRMLGIGELRAKESDRVATVATGLQACGVGVEVGPEHMIVQGHDGPPRGGATVATHLDHRIAMSFLVLGLGCEKPVSIDDAATIDTSFPGFAGLMRALGADLREDR